MVHTKRAKKITTQPKASVCTLVWNFNTKIARCCCFYKAQCQQIAEKNTVQRDLYFVCVCVCVCVWLAGWLLSSIARGRRIYPFASADRWWNLELLLWVVFRSRRRRWRRKKKRRKRRWWRRRRWLWVVGSFLWCKWW